jgi:GntR family transcriptional regulator
VRPVLPSPAERKLLQLPAREAAFLVERRTEARGEPLEWRRTVIRGDQYSFLTRWSGGGDPSATVIVRDDADG